jgi:putative endonuclease
MSNQIRGTLYIDITSDLPDRTWKHRAGSMEGFTKRYGRPWSGMSRTKK